MAKKKTGGRPDLKQVNAGAAAIDIGSNMHMAAVNPDAFRSAGAFIWNFHAGSSRACGMVYSLRRHQCGDGIHRGLLDSGLRDS